jgi:hypothetical protein
MAQNTVTARGGLAIDHGLREQGRHNYYLLWKTTPKNISGKTFHGKFYKTRNDAFQKLRK